MKRTFALATALLFAVAACGDDGPTGPGGNNGDMEATVGGVAFEADAPVVVLSQGVLSLSGTELSGGITTSISIIVIDPEQGATFELNPTFAGTFAQVGLTGGQANSVWTTILAPATGSIHFSTLNSDRAAGTFQFTAQAAPGTAATGQKAVTSGTFDVEF